MKQFCSSLSWRCNSIVPGLWGDKVSHRSLPVHHSWCVWNSKPQSARVTTYYCNKINFAPSKLWQYICSRSGSRSSICRNSSLLFVGIILLFKDLTAASETIAVNYPSHKRNTNIQYVICLKKTMWIFHAANLLLTNKMEVIYEVQIIFSRVYTEQKVRASTHMEVQDMVILMLNSNQIWAEVRVAKMELPNAQNEQY